MFDPTSPTNQDKQPPQSSRKLMVTAMVCSETSCSFNGEVRRGMTILSVDGWEVGKVAAVVLEGDAQKATHLLLSRLPQESGYWLVPLGIVIEITSKGVQLSASKRFVDALPRWQTS